MTLRAIWSILSEAHRRIYLTFILRMFASSLFELIAVSSVALFMKPLVKAHDLDQLFPVGPFFMNLRELAVLTIGLFALSNIGLGWNSYALARFTWTVEGNLSHRVLSKILSNPQDALEDRNSAMVHSDIWCSMLCQKGIRLSLMAWSRICSTVMLVIALLFVNFWATLAAAVTLGAIYFAIHTFLSGPVRRMSTVFKTSNGRRYVLTREFLALRKTLAIRQESEGLLADYDEMTEVSARQAGHQELSTELPRYALETSALAGIVALCMYLTAIHDNRVLELLSLYGLASYRILPGLHYVFCINSDLRFLAPQALETKRMLDTPSPPRPTGRLNLQRSFALEKTTQRYPGREHDVLHSISLRVERGTCVGLAGQSGAGKSTILDICMGCLIPTSGGLLVDDQPLTAQTLANWRRNLGYLPQQVEVLDDTIQANILLGLPLDSTRLQQAVEQACLSTFLATLPEGLQTRVGEGGNLMSVGQRQRLGLARALYEEPEVIVLDEMSSSLDAETEEQILQRVQNWKGSKTMIMAAHRDAVLRVCDYIYLLDQGNLIASGTYPELWEKEPQFRALLSQKDGGELR